MISCKQVAKLLTTDQLAAQSLWKRLQVKLHLSICQYCTLLLRQLQQMHSAARSLDHSIDTEKPGENLEARLLRKLGIRDE